MSARAAERTISATTRIVIARHFTCRDNHRMWGKRMCLVVPLVLAVAACGGPSREDYKAAATSAGAMADRDLHDRWVADRFAELEKATSWAEWGPVATRILCNVDRASSFGQATPNTVSCSSAWVRQAGFDGELPDRIRAFDEIVRAHAWAGHANSIAQPIEYYSKFRGRPEGPGRVYDASNLPGVGYSRQVADTGDMGLGESWTEAGQPVLERPEPSSDLFTHTSGPKQPALITEQLTRHRYVMTLTMSTTQTYPTQ
ncbi:hypothetical protein ACFQ05_23945 [Amycolatopsis umgeniensis]|uniref:Uncharacterized protein n=1 Tax=Amycolatopsis umgeniensis TaxID=336628 RepID=A0A841AVX8_9PSEU|nr:hypothetical protein [Amycolatopsis umgeniensis]MBB5850268.1 hypothetical protein [Amycolatopsis umgeniensis]